MRSAISAAIFAASNTTTMSSRISVTFTTRWRSLGRPPRGA
jgi:hypothetical protein